MLQSLQKLERTFGGRHGEFCVCPGLKHCVPSVPAGWTDMQSTGISSLEPNITAQGFQVPALFVLRLSAGRIDRDHQE